MRPFTLVFSLLALAFAPVLFAAEKGEVSGEAVVRELNLARQNPAGYATHLEEMREHFNGRCFVLPGAGRIFTHEGVAGLNEAIRFLHSVSPVQPLTFSPGLSRGTADHCAEQVGGAIGHGNPASRINRYGRWAGCWGENISYGKNTARDIVIALIVDDGVRDRGHRKNIFAAKFNVAGAAYGPHARYGSVCTIDFAGAYAERGGSSLFARN